MVFDFVDNASQYNMPQSLHRLFKLKEYKPGQLTVAPGEQKAAEAELYAKGEKPEALIDWRGCHRLRAGGYLQLAGRSRRHDLSNGICTPCGCADRNDRTVCPRGETGAGSGRAHERASDFQVFQGRELAEICRAVWLENYQ